MYLYFNKYANVLYASTKTNLAFPFLIAICIIMILLILWSIWRFIWEIMLFVQIFKKTELYLEFGDH
jgi:hypothetical protein